VISNETMTRVVPIFVAAMILLIRVLIIGTFSLAGDRLFTTDDSRARNYPRPAQGQAYRPANQQLRPASSLNRPVQSSPNTFRPTPKPANQTSFMRAEPTYHSYGDPASDRSYDA
jgi:hypothetical protein